MIGLLDCNNFFVSCERLFRPDLRKKPVAVLSSNDGCIVARSQEVKDLGIAMGVPYFQVKDICTKHNIVLFSGNLTFYRDISSRVMQVLEDEVGKIEVYSIDEAFFSLPDDCSVEDLVRIRNRVTKEVGVPVSVGAASTKTRAKHASAIGKKSDGAFLLTDSNWDEYAKQFSCASVWGLGTQTVQKLNARGIHTVADFLAMPLTSLRTHFGVATERVYQELQGKQVFSMQHSKHREQKSIMSTASFAKTTTNQTYIETAIAQHITTIARKLRDHALLCNALQVHIQTNRYGDFFMQGDRMEIMLPEPSADTQFLIKKALEAVQEIYKEGVPYKKAGVSVSRLVPEAYKTQLLFAQEDTHHSTTLDSVTDAINDRFGKSVLQHASTLQTQVKRKASLRSPSYTTSWKDIPSVRA